jgi:hypothetical protein
MVALLLASLAFAESLQATQPVACTRWPGEKGISLALQPGDEVEVVAREGTRVRVRKGTEYGWAEESALTPVAAAPTDAIATETADAATAAADKAATKPTKEKPASRKRGKRRPASSD